MDDRQIFYIFLWMDDCNLKIPKEILLKFSEFFFFVKFWNLTTTTTKRRPLQNKYKAFFFLEKQFKGAIFRHYI
jgi:hypothetical protein